ATQHDAAEIVPFDVDGIAAGDTTWGHRFMAPQPIKVRRFDDYAEALHKAKVVLDADRRKAIILADAQSLAFARGLELIEDEGLLEEVAGLVEWPVVLMGEGPRAVLPFLGAQDVGGAAIAGEQVLAVLRVEQAPQRLDPPDDHQKVVLARQREHRVDEVVPRALVAQVDLEALGDEGEEARGRCTNSRIFGNPGLSTGMVILAHNFVELGSFGEPAHC